MLRSLIFISLYISKIAVNGELDVQNMQRHLSPKDIGLAHTAGFNRLGEKYSREKPQHINEVVSDIMLIAAEYCPANDDQCMNKIYELTWNESQINRSGHKLLIDYPDYFDPKVKDILGSVESTINLLTFNNVDYVTELLSQHEKELENMNDVDQESQIIGLLGISVAIESSKLWHDAITNTDHSLYEMVGYFSSHGGRDRKLQGIGDDYEMSFSPFDLIPIVLADFMAALGAGFDVGNIIQNPVSLISVIGPSITGSMMAAFTESSTDDFGYYLFGDDYYNDDDDDDGDDAGKIISGDDDDDMYYYNDIYYDDDDDDYSYDDADVALLLEELFGGN